LMHTQLQLLYVLVLLLQFHTAANMIFRCQGVTPHNCPIGNHSTFEGSPYGLPIAGCISIHYFP
jgi:hypothetical protein